MPRNSGIIIPLETLPPDERLREDRPSQRHWAILVRELSRPGQSIVDVGAGGGQCIDALGPTCRDVLAIDPWPISPLVQRMCVEELPDHFYDWACALDVIEHVENDHEFLRQLLRVAREAAFISTPNHNYWGQYPPMNPAHVREYSPAELKALLADVAPNIVPEFWWSDADCIPHGITTLEDGACWPNLGVLLRVA